MQTSDSNSSRQPGPSFRPHIGDIIARKLTATKASCAAVLDIYENILGERVYRLQTVWRLVELKGPHLNEQAVLDTLSYYPATRQDFQSEYQETIAWYLRIREELYQAIRPFVEDNPFPEDTSPITLDVTSWQPSPFLQYLNLDFGTEDQPERSFRPCIGDIIMRGIEPNMGGCAVVLNILEDAFGDRVYHIQTTRGLAAQKGPEQVTQTQLDYTTYHPAVREDFHEALQSACNFYQAQRDELYQVVKPYVEITD